MSTAGSFSVQSQALRSLAAALDNQQQQLASALKAFEPTALDVTGAFGAIGSSAAVENGYLNMTERARTVLGTLAWELGDASRALSETAASYDDTEQSVRTSFTVRR